ncbi:MAG: universal stress protein [Microcoleus sp. SU_5_3]|nr:universal stress protein [Microcoleus sp. SU_5_3]
MEIHRILVPVKNLIPQTIRTIRFAQIFAEANGATITLLHVSDRKTNTQKIIALEEQLKHILQTQIKPQIEITTQFIRDDNVATAIVKTAENYDMVVLRSMRRRTAGGLAVSDISDRVVKALKCSIVLFGEPHLNS